MENLSHSLCGVRIAELGWTTRLGPRARWIGLVAANLPDVDLLVSLVNRDVGTWYHRGLTHSFFGWPLLALVGAAVSRRWVPGAYRDHLALWAWCLLSHALMDWPTTWGTLLFWPVSDHRFGLDAIFIVDPVYWLVLGLLPRLVGPARSLMALLGWLAFSLMMREVAIARAPARVYAWPAPLAPLYWTGVSTEGDHLTRWWLTPWSATEAGTFDAPTGEAVERLLGSHVGERTFWMGGALALHDAVRAPGEWTLTLVDLAYTSSWDPDSFRFRSRFRVYDDGRVERLR